jgi:hypothetical protein
MRTASNRPACRAMRRMPDVCDVPRDRLVGSNGKDAVLDGDRRQLKMLTFARLAQSPSLFVASLEFANHVAASCSIFLYV